MGMERRDFLLSAAAYALPVPKSNDLAFKVLRNGTIVGEHHLAFSQDGDALTVTANVELLVTVALIPVFRYNLQATERWQGGVFQSLDSAVNFNGNPLTVHAVKVANGYEVEGTNRDVPAKTTPRYLAPPDTLPLTYWNKQMLSGTILNVQTAHSCHVHVASPGWTRLPTASGGAILARRFDTTGKLVLSVWYDTANAWSGLEFQKDGDITYQKITS
jgi:hypothetical protein